MLPALVFYVIACGVYPEESKGHSLHRSAFMAAIAAIY